MFTVIVQYKRRVERSREPFEWDLGRRSPAARQPATAGSPDRPPAVPAPPRRARLRRR